MSRTLLRVPKMFTSTELLEIDPRLPDDLEDRRKEFWNYVSEKVLALGTRVKKIYLSALGVRPNKQLELLKLTDPEMYEVVRKTIEQGAELIEAENPELVLESISWMEQLRGAFSPNGGDKVKLETLNEFLAESLRERDEYMARRIGETLGEGEVGVLIVDDSRRLHFPEDIRVITTCPFQPRDYLNSWIATLRLRDQKQPEEPRTESSDKA